MRCVQFGIGIGYQADGTPITSEESQAMIAEAMRRLSRAFGGGFVVRGRGFWTAPGGSGPITEDGITITIDTSDSDEVIRLTAELLRHIFRQQAIHVAISDVSTYDWEGR